MQKFRNLTKNIFFKIFLIFIAFTFVGFGMTDIFTGSGTWVAKVGDRAVDYDEYVKKLNQSSSLIYNSNPTEENLDFVKSSQFKIMVLQKTVAEAIIREIRDDFNFSLQKQILLKNVVNNEIFFDNSKKFNRQHFINFLKFNNLTEKAYLERTQDDIFNKIINKSLQNVNKENEEISKILYKNYTQSRNIDIIKFSENDLKIKKKAIKKDLKKFYNENKNLFFFPESREISYIEFDKEEFAHQIKVSDIEIKNEYDKNTANFTIAEKRDFYHLLFNSKKEAKNFEEKIANINLSEKKFLQAIKSNLNKEKDDILLKEVAAKDMIEDLRKKPFKLQKGEKTEVIKSDVGYHVFYLAKIIPQKVKNISEVKGEIKKNLEKSKLIKYFINIKKEIDESLILNNSLDQISNEFRLKIKKTKGIIEEKSNLDNFWTNSFALKEKSLSKIFESPSNDKYYIILIDKVNKRRSKNYQEAKLEVKKQVEKNHKIEYLNKFVANANKNLLKNPKYFYKISSKENLKISNKTITQNSDLVDKKFIEEIFNLKKPKTITKVKKYGDLYQASFLKKIKNKFNEKEFKNFVKQSKVGLNKEILEEYNKYLKKKYQIRYNDKILNSILGINNE